MKIEVQYTDPEKYVKEEDWMEGHVGPSAWEGEMK